MSPNQWYVPKKRVHIADYIGRVTVICSKIH